MEENTQTGQHLNKLNKNTGAKIAKYAIAAAVITAVVGVGSYYAINEYNDYKETERVSQLVAAYTDTQGYCALPDEIIVNKAYDEKFADGAKLATELASKGVKYCEVLDEYYTPSGTDIAILTFKVTMTEVVNPNRYDFNGTTMYSAPAGYVLKDGKCYKETYKTITKIVPKEKNSDYSGYTIPNVSVSELLSAKEVSTKPYEEIIDQDLICDVRDGVTLDESKQCPAQLTLVPKN